MPPCYSGSCTSIGRSTRFGMSETSQFLSSSPSAKHNALGPDFFGFYTREISVFLSQDEDYLPENSNFEGKDSLTNNSHKSTEDYKIGGSTPLFSNAIGAHISDFRKERLRSLVCQSLFAFTKEVDEILNPVHRICRVQSLLRYKKSMLRLSGGLSEPDHGHPPEKKQKTSNLSSSLSGACGMKCRPDEGTPPATELNEQLYLDKTGTDYEKEIDDDLLVLLDNDCTMVEEMTKKHSEELFATIRHMEQKLEEFLDILMSNCRSMTLAEKQQLQKLIQDLPPRNLDRVVEIIQRNKPIDGRPSNNEIYVDLENENKVTLWRLYYYVEAVENARKLCPD